MKFINLTPHALRLRREADDRPEPQDSDLVLEPDGRVARLEQVVLSATALSGMAVRRTTLSGRILDLPAPEPETVYIVSLPVAQQAGTQQGRTDIVSPGDLFWQNGHPALVRRLQQYLSGDVAWREQYDAAALAIS